MGPGEEGGSFPTHVVVRRAQARASPIWGCGPLRITTAMLKADGRSSRDAEYPGARPFL